jgi:hypothetical protein
LELDGQRNPIEDCKHVLPKLFREVEYALLL